MQDVCGRSNELEQRCKENLIFPIPMVWRESRNHIDECYILYSKIILTRTKRKFLSELATRIETGTHADSIRVAVPRDIADYMPEIESS